MTEDKNIYVNTYFRINAGYVWGHGMPSEGGSEAFFKECDEILSRLGFVSVPSNISAGCPRAHRGVENLYCHPMDLSGYVRTDAIKGIATALKSAKTFTLRCVDTFKECFNYTSEELRSELEGRKAQVEEIIRKEYGTHRKNLMKRYNDNLRTGITYFTNGLVNGSAMERVETSYFGEVFAEMIAKGEIIEGKDKFGNRIFRAVPKTKKKAGMFQSAQFDFNVPRV